jgi:hypothetical protein
MSLSTEVLGVSPLSQGISVALASDAGGAAEKRDRHHHHQLSKSVNVGGHRHAVHRTSIVPGDLPSTDEYAKILFQSRNAKMRKWKTGSGSDSGSPTPRSWERSAAVGGGGGGAGGLSASSGLPGRQKDQGEEVQEVDITDGDGESSRPALNRTPSSHLGTSNEIEWVDWLDEYRKMKEAKRLADERKQQEGSEMGPELEMQVGETPASEIGETRSMGPDPMGKPLLSILT